jgi:hypothetical protein
MRQICGPLSGPAAKRTTGHNVFIIFSFLPPLFRGREASLEQGLLLSTWLQAGWTVESDPESI